MRLRPGLLVLPLLALVARSAPAQNIVQIIDGAGDGVNPLIESRAVATDGDGNVFVVGRDSDNVFKITPSGQITQIIDATGDGAGNPLAEPRQGLDVDADGNVYVLGRNSDNAFRIAPDGQITEIIDASGDGTGNPLDEPRDIAVGLDGNIYVSAASSTNAFRITPGGQITEIIDATGDGMGNALELPERIAADAAGNVYVTANGINRLFKITAAGVVSVVMLDVASDIVAGPDGSLYAPGSVPPVFASGFHRIDPDGSITSFPDTTGLYLDTFGDVAVGPDGRVFLAGFGQKNAFQVTPDGTFTEIFDASGDGMGNTVDEANGIAVSPDGNTVYLSGRDTNNVFAISVPEPASGLGLLGAALVLGLAGRARRWGS